MKIAKAIHQTKLNQTKPGCATTCVAIDCHLIYVAA